MSTLGFDTVCAAYSGRTVLRNVTSDFASGEVTGLVGPNGAGKTTLLRVAVRLLKPEGGAVELLDRPLAEWSAPALARAIAYLPQNSETHWPITAYRLVALGRLPHRSISAPLSGADERAVRDALSRCDADDLANRRMDELSAGERARILLARSLAVCAPVLLVDEPAAHLDPSHQIRLMELLRMEAARGAAIVVTLHDLSLASRFCDRVVVMHKGKIEAQGSAAEALDDNMLRTTFGINARRVEGSVVPWQRL